MNNKRIDLAYDLGFADEVDGLSDKLMFGDISDNGDIGALYYVNLDLVTYMGEDGEEITCTLEEYATVRPELLEKYEIEG